MVESALVFAILVCVIVGLFYLVTWAMGQMGLTVPDYVMKVLWVIVVLVILLLAWRTFSPLLGLRI